MYDKLKHVYFCKNNSCYYQYCEEKSIYRFYCRHLNKCREDIRYYKTHKFREERDIRKQKREDLKYYKQKYSNISIMKSERLEIVGDCSETDCSSNYTDYDYDYDSDSSD